MEKAVSKQKKQLTETDFWLKRNLLLLILT